VLYTGLKVQKVGRVMGSLSGYADDRLKLSY